MKPLLTQFIDTIRTITGITRENMTDMTAQEIAGLLGETTAETKAILTQLRDSILEDEV